MPDSLRAILRCAGVLAYFQGDMAALRRHAGALMALGRSQQDKFSIALAFFFLGQDALHKEDFRQAEGMFEKSLVLARVIGEHEHSASTLLMLGEVAHGEREHGRALAFYAESLEIYRKHRNRWLESFVLSNSAQIHIEQGDLEEARAFCRQSLLISQELDDRRTLSQTLEQVAGLYDLEGDTLRATRLIGAADALRDVLFVPVEPLERVTHESLLARLKAKQGDSAFTAACAEGRRMTLEQALEYALPEWQSTV